MVPAIDRRSVVDGELRRLSVSQIAIFDPTQVGGCNRRWWFRYVAGIKEPESAAQQRGTEIHSHIKHYLTTGEDVLPALVRVGKHIIPAPGPDLLVEHEFTAENRLLVADGVPLIGAIDLAHRRGTYLNDQGALREDGPRTAEVIDWKSSADVALYAKRGDQLIDTVQMPGYGVVLCNLWPDLDFVRLSHGYFQTRGARYSEKRTALFPIQTITERWSRVEGVVRSMRDVAKEKGSQRVEPTWESCTAFKGCPHRDKCPRSPGQAIVDLLGKGKTMSLLNKRNNQGSNSSAGTLAKEGVGPAANAAAINAEVERLKQQEATLAAQAAGRASPFATNPAVAAQAPICFNCAAPLNQMNASRLPNGIFLHIGCPKSPALVTPPDAPASNPALAAAPVPPETLPTLSPEARAAAIAHAQHNAPPAGVVPASDERAPSGRGRRKNNSGEKSAEAQPPAASTPTPPPDVPEGVHDVALLVDVYGHGIGEVRDLMADYVNPLCEDLAKEYGAADVQCAPDASPLGFGKWKGALAALIRAKPPAAGTYRVDHVHESEVKGIAVSTLQPICATFLRGAR